MPCSVKHQLHKHSTQEGVCAPEAEEELDGFSVCRAEVPSGQKMPISISEVLAVADTVVPVTATVCGLSCDSVKSHL